MGSFKGYGRHEGPKRRRNHRNPKREGLPSIEFLEARQLLTGDSSQIPAPLWRPTDTNLYDVQNGPMANMGQELISVYKAFIQSGGNTSSLATEFPEVEFNNGMIGTQVKSLGGDFSQFVTTLRDVGLHVTSSSAYYGLVDGWAPVNALPTIAEAQQTMSGSPLYKPTYNFQGAADNEAGSSTFAYDAQSQFNVTGSGVTVGVISDSVNQFGGGLAASYGTGDLNAAQPVNVINDGPAGSTDEGRAMLENIHDIAPGASLAFDTSGISDLSMSQAVVALANTAKSNIIVDDVKFPDDPVFQDGLISQAVDTVVGQGTTYFSSAGNQANAGYLSSFRSAQGNIAGIGSGTFMNFNPSGSAVLQLPITTAQANLPIFFQFDQPFATQEPAGDPNVVTSSVSIFLLDSTGAVVASGNANNVATQAPLQMVTAPAAGTYTVVMQLVSGQAPGHVEFYTPVDAPAMTVSQQFGSAGGTFYPTTIGHEATANTIGVGAVPWWAPAPFVGQTPLASEGYSSDGPEIFSLNPDGSTRATPVTVENPTITAPDGGNTSFFSPGNIINTTNQPPFFPGEPSTSTNLSQDLPSFFGTSSAAPNAAAIAALMLQEVPSLTPAEIKAGLIASASTHPMNGAAPGAWDPQGGFGLVNAIDALNAVNLLRVQTANPANGATVTATPSAITVTFNKAVNFATISAADLVFLSTPAGVVVTVGTPIAVDNPTDPTIVHFPITFSKPAGTLANGKFTYAIQSPTTETVTSKDGKVLVPSGPISFTLADVTAPTIISTSESGRIVTVNFSKALDPSTVTLANIFVIRQGGAATWNPTAANLASYIDLNNDPRTVISYSTGINPSTGKPFFTVTLDYSALPQTELPSDNYAIVVQSANPAGAGVTDLVGNSLDGNFTGAFPSARTASRPTSSRTSASRR